MPALEQSVETGVSFGRYRGASRLASGGMANVWLARLTGAEGFEKEVVIKTMLSKFASSSDLVSMFVNEATIAARFNHPNIVQVFDFGCLAGHHYMVMEHVAGKTLRQLQRGLRDTGELFPHRVLLNAITDVCYALRYAHELRDSSGGWLEFVHGDISPENVMVSHGGTAKLIDFGAAHIKSSPRLNGKFIGKCRYTSPECLTGAAGDRRSDIYSLGVMLYEFLTGIRPYDGDDKAIVAQVRQGRPRHPLELMPDLPTDLVEMTLTAMAADPRERYQTAEELANAIAHFLHQDVDAPELVVCQAGGENPGPNAENPIDEATIVSEEGAVHGERPRPVRPSLLFEPRPHIPHDTPDIFSMGRTAANWASATQPIADPAPPGDYSTNHEAARHFDRGFTLVAAKRYLEALQEWQLALAGDPANRTYQTNIRRLREHVQPTALDDHRG